MGDESAADRETRIATALQALAAPEVAAYRYFLTHKQTPIAPEKADELFKLYQRGSTCNEIRRLFPQFSLSQIVAARVMCAWDERRGIEIKMLATTVPALTETVELEMRELVGNMLHASRAKINDALKRYIATGDETALTTAGIQIPTSTKALKELVELFRTLSGTDVKKVEVQVRGNVAHAHEMKRVDPKEAESIMDNLLSDEIQDAEFSPVPPPQIEAVPQPAGDPDPEKTIEALVSTGMPRERAEQVVGKIKKAVDIAVDSVKPILDEVKEDLKGAKKRKAN